MAGDGGGGRGIRFDTWKEGCLIQLRAELPSAASVTSLLLTANTQRLVFGDTISNKHDRLQPVGNNQVIILF